MVIFDCNGVLIDGERLAAQVAAAEFTRAGVPMTEQIVSQFFTGRRASDMILDVQTATGKRLPSDLAATITDATIARFKSELRPTAHAAHALTWIRGPKCVASSSSLTRIRASLEATDLIRFFQPNLFSAVEARRGKPAPDLFLHAAWKMRVQPADCVVVEDSVVGVAAAQAAGMIPIGFVGASHAHPQLPAQLTAAGARAVIADMRVLKSTIVALRGW